MTISHTELRERAQSLVQQLDVKGAITIAISSSFAQDIVATILRLLDENEQARSDRDAARQVRAYVEAENAALVVKEREAAIAKVIQLERGDNSWTYKSENARLLKRIEALRAFVRRIPCTCENKIYHMDRDDHYASCLVTKVTVVLAADDAMTKEEKQK